MEGPSGLGPSSSRIGKDIFSCQETGWCMLSQQKGLWGPAEAAEGGGFSEDYLFSSVPFQ